jgi:hypothetical protein
MTFRVEVFIDFIYIEVVDEIVDFVLGKFNAFALLEVFLIETMEMLFGESGGGCERLFILFILLVVGEVFI